MEVGAHQQRDGGQTMGAEQTQSKLTAEEAGKVVRVNAKTIRRAIQEGCGHDLPLDGGHHGHPHAG